MIHCTRVFAVRYEEEEITNERVSEYKHTTQTFTEECEHDPAQQQSSRDYPEPTNKSSALIAALISDFDEAKARYEANDTNDTYGDEWWHTECVRLKLKLEEISLVFNIKHLSSENDVPIHTQKDRRHETTANRKSVKNRYIEYIGGGVPTVVFDCLNNLIDCRDILFAK